jgi:DNA-binding MarR family transcriptional regulator
VEGRTPGGELDERARLAARIDGAGHDLSELFLAQRLEPFLSTRLTVPQLRALAVLQIDGPSGAHRLADVLGVSAATVTGIVDRLVAAGMVERRPDPHDRRVRLVATTPRGADAVRELAAREEPTQHLLARLDLDDLRALARGVEALVAAARAEPERAEPERAEPERKAPLDGSP